MIQNLETTLRAGAVPQVPQFNPASAQPSQQSTVNVNRSSGSARENVVDNKVDTGKEPNSAEAKTPEKITPSAKTAEEKSSTNGAAVDPLGDARARVQEEISREFVAIMATGTLRASEAAALATRRVMQKHGHLNVAVPDS